MVERHPSQPRFAGGGAVVTGVGRRAASKGAIAWLTLSAAAELVAFLCSPGAASITGQVMRPDDGWSTLR